MKWAVLNQRELVVDRDSIRPKIILNMKKELHIFLTALMFYTRIPCPKNIDHNPYYLNKASRYFPLVGCIVGSVAFTVFYIFNYLGGAEIAIILSMIASVLVTGGFHEDGFADVCDGFGGGWTKEKILTIMKDSAIGAYGAIGLILLLLLKYQGLSQLVPVVPNSNFILFLLFIAGHAISRLAAISIVFTHEYSRDDASSKSKPIAQSYSWREIVGAVFFGLFPLVLLSYFQWQIMLVLIPVFVTRFFLARYFQKWIDGYTGDCLGATQQVCEVIFYLTVTFTWKFI